MNPSVDIVVPCYNYGRFLRSCVDSILSQPSVDLRVLIIDDCSSDDTPAIGMSLAADDRRVAFRRHDVNRGHIATFNEGLIGWSEADYAVLLSADDMLMPGSLSRAVQIMERDRSVGLVYGYALPLHDRLPPERVGGVSWDCTRWPGHRWLEGRCRDGHNVISSPEVVIRGSLQRSLGGYRPELPHSGDLEMWLRAAAVSNIAYVRGTPQAYYRVHQASMLRTRFSNKLADLQQRKAAFDAFFEGHAELPDRERLQRMAYRALAREALWDACRAYDRDEVEQAGAISLERFANAIYSGETPEAAALRRRRRLGPALCRRTKVFAIPAIARRLRTWLRRERWKRCGV